MSIKFERVECVGQISPKEFRLEFLKKEKPLVIKGLSKGWRAITKRIPGYLKVFFRRNKVTVYDSAKVSYTKKVNEPETQMLFEDYINLITSQPTNLRIFLFNIFKNAPSLCDDNQSPDLSSGFLDKFPMMFFGGANSQFFLHYDLDMSHVFHTQTYGRKKALLFLPAYSKFLYRMPFSVHDIEDIDLGNPDYVKFPALREVSGCRCELEPGGTLFMPSVWWYFMKYLEGGYALSQRAFPSSYKLRLRSFYNLFIMRKMDGFARRLMEHKWLDWEYKKAIENAEKKMKF